MDFIAPDLQAYSERFTSPEPEVLAALNRETWLKVPMPRMLSGHIQGRMLAFFSKMLRPRRILEIGTYTGYSAICLAEGLSSDGKLDTLDINADLEEMALRYFEAAGLSQRVKMHIGDARKLIPDLDGPYDLVFIDADKESYCDYLDLVLPKMRAGAVILADNVLWSGKVLDPKITDLETQGLRNFVQKVASRDDLEFVLLPVRDGIMAVMKK
ncbi:MAG: O-methyltransferase [Bacteroidetes bacterium]|nr:O-methyltransferase [Bacteroidota bacterium]MBP6639647.1 O-methyltransferase [Bacteroidia bacterium]MBP6721465.1 O-methyltransferase [Bacteroidia bacterium]